MKLQINKISQALGFTNRNGYFIGGCVLALNTMIVVPSALAQENNDNDNDEGIEEIVVTARFREENLQETPIAITAITGEMLEEQSIQSIGDLGLIIPNANIRQTNGGGGPNAQIGLRGVDQAEFIPAFEPGVGVYVDDIYHGTLTGSTMDLLDLERVEVLRGPQGTLFGKNSLGGAIRMISKAPRGDDTGHFQATIGDLNRLDFSGSYDFSLIEDLAFMRISGVSKQIDGYMDRLDFTCQMIANGTPELAGSFPTTLLSNNTANGNCKIGEKGGSDSNAAKIMLRVTPSDDLEFNFSADYSKTVADVGAETLLVGTDPTQDPTTSNDGVVQSTIIDPRWNPNPGDALTIFGNTFVTGDVYTSYESYEDPILGTRWPSDQTTESWNVSAKVDYDISENMHVKGIFGYRTYETLWANTNNTPFSFNTTLNAQDHDQTSLEVQLSGLSFNERLEWTVGGYYFDSNDLLGGYVNFGTFGLALPFFPTGFDQNDTFNNESESFFAHGVFAITEDLSLTAGIRQTNESKTYDFDHTGLLTIPAPLSYGQEHIDWKVSLDYQISEDYLVYGIVSTGFRSEGANPRPFVGAQLQEVSGEEITAYEIGFKADFLNNRLRINTAAFINEYDPRLVNQLGAQCTDPTGTDPGEYIVPFASEPCPAGSFVANNGGGFGQIAFVYFSAPGTAKGLEFEVTASPIDFLDINASFGYYNYETDLSASQPGFTHPDYKAQADYSWNLGAQYVFSMDSGATIIPRIDIFYQGERNNSGLDQAPIEPWHVVPDYTLANARVTYMSFDGGWSASLEAQNLFDEFYWINLGPERAQNGIDTAYNRTGTPSRPRTISLTFRRNF